MTRSRILIPVVLVMILAAGSLLTGCGATAAPTTAPTVAAKTIPPTTLASATVPPTAVPTKAPPTNTPSPTTGGTLKIGLPAEPPTLDAQLAGDDFVQSFLGASLVGWAPDGKIVPWLAESWTTSGDGLVWDFTLRKGVKFQDGTPFTAADYVYTFQRAMNPDTKALVTKSTLGPLTRVEAVNDYQLRLTLAQAYAPLLLSLSAPGYMMPLSKAWVEKWEDQYGRHPMSVGPYVFKEWQTGQKITFERNPDYNWGPSYAHSGPAYIQTIEFRITPEHATILAGLQTGEIDNAFIDPQDLALIGGTNKFQILEGLAAGANPSLWFNCSQAPFDDGNVRLAFNYAVDRASLVKVAVGDGNGVPQGSPLSRPMFGYSADVEKVGYTFDLAKAKDLMKQAGYTLGAGGFLEKGGVTLKVDLVFQSQEAVYAKVAQVLQEQYKALGVQINLVQQEVGAWFQGILTGQYTVAIATWTYSDGDILYVLYHSGSEGDLNPTRISNDPELNNLLELTRSTSDSTRRLEAMGLAQKRIIDQGYMGPLYTPKTFYCVSTRVKGVSAVDALGYPYLQDAYIETK